MRWHFLVDASALVPLFFIPKRVEDKLPREAVLELLYRRRIKEAALYIPNFCMAECSKAFAKILLFGKKPGSGAFEEAMGAYRTKVEQLLDLVSRSKTGEVLSFPLERSHLEDVEDFFEAEYQLSPRDEGKLLSGLDSLVISMGRALARKYGDDKVRIVTGDKEMANTCNSLGVAPRAVYTYRDRIPA